MEAVISLAIAWIFHIALKEHSQLSSDSLYTVKNKIGFFKNTVQQLWIYADVLGGSCYALKFTSTVQNNFMS